MAKEAARVSEIVANSTANILQDLATTRQDLQREIEANLVRARLALREADLLKKANDEAHRNVTPASQSTPSEPAPSTSQTPDTPATGPRDDPPLPVLPRQSGLVRDLSPEEAQRRRNDRCSVCSELGHWGCDHLAYLCITCQKYAPGHVSGGPFCPRRVGTSSVAFSSADNYVYPESSEHDDFD